MGGALASHCGGLCCGLGATGYGEEGGLWDGGREVSSTACSGVSLASHCGSIGRERPGVSLRGRRGGSARFALLKIVLCATCYGEEAGWLVSWMAVLLSGHRAIQPSRHPAISPSRCPERAMFVRSGCDRYSGFRRELNPGEYCGFVLGVGCVVVMLRVFGCRVEVC